MLGCIVPKLSGLGGHGVGRWLGKERRYSGDRWGAWSKSGWKEVPSLRDWSWRRRGGDLREDCGGGELM